MKKENKMEVELDYLVGYSNTINSYIAIGYTVEEAIKLADKEDALDRLSEDRTLDKEAKDEN